MYTLRETINTQNIRFELHVSNSPALRMITTLVKLDGRMKQLQATKTNFCALLAWKIVHEVSRLLVSVEFQGCSHSRVACWLHPKWLALSISLILVIVWKCACLVVSCT